MTVDPLIGQTLDGRYEIIEPIGKGSMGIVYRARQLSVDRDVAVKVITPETIPATLSTGAFERFQNEAKTISNLRHPNTVKLYDFGKTEDGRLYLVMELLHGQPLDKLLEKGPLDEKRTLSILRQVADSLAEAHQNGIVHRDLKPANIFVDQVGGQEVVKVLDFGIAKVAAHPMQTATGAVIGTPAYMSPEQAQGEPIDAATDVYCLGILAYQCLSGGLPFESDTPVGVLMKHVNEPPPPLSDIRISEGTERLVMRMLSKDPKQRPATAAEVQKAFSDPDKQPAAGKPGPTPRRGWLLGIAAAALAGLVAMGVILFFNLTEPPEKAPEPGATVAVTQLTAQPGFEGQPTISPDGKFVAYTSNAAGNNDIYLLRVGGDRPINLTADSKAHESWPAFSPDGEQIAFVSMRDPPGVYVMGAMGESQRRLVDKAFNPCWSRDGREIFYTTELIDFLEGPYSRNMTSALWAVEVESGKRRQITESDVMQPDASPNGYRIAFWAAHSGRRDIWTIGVDGKNPVAVTKDAPTDYNPVWSPSGEYLYFLSDRSGTMNLWRVPIDEKSGQVRGPLEQLTSGAANMYDLAISRSGLLAYNNQDKSFKIMRTEFDAGKEELTGNPVDVLETSSDVEWLDLSPDGKYLTYVSGPADDIVITGTDGKNRRFLTRDEHFNRFPRFSPDGKSLAFYSNRGGSYEIWQVNIDGTGKRQLTKTKGDTVYHSWSPDGKRIAFLIIGDGLDGLYVVDVPEDEPAENFTKLSDSSIPFGLVYPTSWSPDGRMLAGFFATTGGIPIAYTYSFGDQKIEKLAEDSYLPTWLSDSQRLLSVTLVTGKLELMDYETKRRKELLQLPQGTALTGLAVSADDSEIYFTTAHITADLWLLRVE